MKHFLPFNKEGNIEIGEKQLKAMLSDAYREGYVQGKIDHILNNAPDFAILKDREDQKKKTLSGDGKTLIFRATIL